MDDLDSEDAESCCSDVAYEHHLATIRGLGRSLVRKFRRKCSRRKALLVLLGTTFLLFLVYVLFFVRIRPLQYARAADWRDSEEPFIPSRVSFDTEEYLKKVGNSKLFRKVLIDYKTQEERRVYSSREEHELLDNVNVRAACKRILTVDRGASLNPKVRGNGYTIVTGYFNLGTFQKGAAALKQSYSKQMYFEWVTGFKFVLNDVIVFTDDPDFYREFLRVRSYHYQMRTAVCLVDRNTLWPFKLLPIIEAVHGRHNYPLFYPDTAIAEYGAVMHGKYAMMEIALDWNPFPSKYYAWVDSGTFRELVSDFPHLPWLKHVSYEALEQSFYLAVPTTHNKSCIAMNQVDKEDFRSPMLQIFLKNKYWVGGGYFLALKDVMRRWIEQYIRAVLVLSEMGLSNTDQQAIYAMFHPESLSNKRMHPDLSALVPIQSFRKQERDSVNEWFYLPFRTRNEWFMALRGIKCNKTTMHLDCSSTCVHYHYSLVILSSLIFWVHCSRLL